MIDGKRGGRTAGGGGRARTRKPAGTIMIIINFTDTIGYRLYLFSTTGYPTSVFALPAIESRGRERDEVVRDTGRGTVFTSPESNDDMRY